jgi:phage gp45-like
MVIRTSVKDASRRAQTSASRATLREMNSKPYWSEAKQLDVTSSETATDVEYVENYGGTSVPAKQDEEEDEQQGQQQGQQGGNGGGGPGGSGGTPGKQGKQPKGDAAEAIVLYLNGSRSHPVIISVGDRRHRLVELEEGDVAQHRLKEDRQQMLYSKDGTYLSTRIDKVMRIALVPKEPKDEEQQQGGNGGNGGAGGQGQQKKKKTYGQKSAKDDNKNSEVYIEQKGNETTVRHGAGHHKTRGGDAIGYHDTPQHSYRADGGHVHIFCDDSHIWVSPGGCFSSKPMVVKRDDCGGG